MTARIPPQLKLLSGTARADRTAPDPSPLPALDNVPPAPDWLPNAHAANEWRRLAPVLMANKLLTTANIGAFGQLCAVHGRLVALWAASETPRAALISIYRGLLADLGLSAMPAPSNINPANRFANNGRKPVARARRPAKPKAKQP
jgi:phage terminase small subunit